MTPIPKNYLTMPLPQARPRQRIHRRSIRCDGFLREDGLWDIEAHLTDVKSISVTDSQSTNVAVAAGDAYHDMWLRVTIDESLKIHEVQATMESSPFSVCKKAVDTYKKLEGTRIGPGWRSKAAELVGGVKGCTHLHELLPVIATTAFQSLWPAKDASALAGGLEMVLDSCQAWSRDGEVADRVRLALASNKSA